MSAPSKVDWNELSSNCKVLVDSVSLAETFDRAGLTVKQFALQQTPTKPQSFNAIDSRDLADVYLSSLFNEPCSTDIANLVKRFVVEGSIQEKSPERPPIRPMTDPSAVISPTVIDPGQDVLLGDICNQVSSFSLDEKASTLWWMRQAVLNKMLEAIQEESDEGEKRSVTEKRRMNKKMETGKTWHISPLVFNPTAKSTKHEHTLNLVNEKRRSTARCDVCRKREKCQYCCASCDWDICEDCIKPELVSVPVAARGMPPVSGTVNWMGNEKDKILFHFNPRIKEKQIVMNSKLNGSWGSEERIKLPSSDTFQVKIIVDSIGFHVYLNGNEIKDHLYKHREPFKNFSQVECDRYTAYLEPSLEEDVSVKDGKVLYFVKRDVVTKEETVSFSKSVFILNPVHIAMFSATIQVLDPLQKKMALKDFLTSLLEIFASVIPTESTLIGTGDGSYWCPLTQMLPGSPLAIAVEKLELLVLQHLDSLLSGPPDLLTISTANAEVSFLFAIAILQNSLSGILRVLEYLLRCSWISSTKDTKEFWKLVSVTTIDFNKSNSDVVLGVLESVNEITSSNNKLLPFTSIGDAEILIRWVSTFGLIDIGQNSDLFTPETLKIANYLCSYAAKMLQTNITRIIPSVDMGRRVEILGSLGPQLKKAIDEMIKNDSRDPHNDVALSSCIDLYVSTKDVLIPDFSEQFYVASTLVSKSMSGEHLTPGEKALGACLMFELSNSDLMDILKVASPDSLIRTMLLLLDLKLKKMVEVSFVSSIDEVDVDTRRMEEEVVQQLTSFNKFVMYTIGSYRDVILKSTDEKVVEEQFMKFIDLTGLLLSTAKHHLENPEILSVEVIETISTSFVGSVLPVVLFALHSLLREAKEKKLNFPKATLAASRMFSGVGRSFKAAYEILRRKQSVSTPPLSREASADSKAGDEMSLTRSISTGSSSFPKLDVLRSSGRVTFNHDFTTCATELFDMSSFDPENLTADTIPLALVYCDVVYRIEEGADKTGNYFELEILESDDRRIAVGLQDPNDPANFFDPTKLDGSGLPGSSPSSYAFELAEGRKMHRKEHSDESLTSFSVGDTVGCGFNMKNRSIFVTRNGLLLGTVFENVGAKFLSPILLLSCDESKHKLKINFGRTYPFKYSGPEVVLHPAIRPLPLLSRSTSLVVADTIPLPWLNMIVDEILSIRLVTCKALIAYANEIKYEGVPEVVLEGHKKWISSPFFSLGMVNREQSDQPYSFMWTLVEDYDNPLCVHLISAMQKLVLEDRRNKPKEENHLVHVTCAALIWHKGLAAEALAIAEKRRDSPSKSIVSIWRFAQKIRSFLDEGDLHNAKDQAIVANEENRLESSSKLYPGADASVRSSCMRDCFDRACQLLKMNSVKKTSPELSTKKMWKAAASLLGLQSKSQPDSPYANSIFKVSKFSSTKKWLHDAISSRSMEKRSLKIEEALMSFVQRGPTSQMIYSMIEIREEAVELRIEGLSAALDLLHELSKVEEKTRILMGLIEAIHSHKDVHYVSELCGISETSLTKLSNSWYALNKVIVDDCLRWLQECGTSVAISTSTTTKQTLFHRALLCGLSVAVLDFRPSDAAGLRDSGLLLLLSKMSYCPHYALRSLSLKWTELILQKCCISRGALDSDETLEVSVSSENKDASDALLPSLLEIFRTKVLNVVESNIPKSLPSSMIEKQPTLEAEVHLLLKQTILCSATEPGFVCPHKTVPVNHSFGMWVFRPFGVSDGILFVKGGAVKDENNIQPWSRITMKMNGGFLSVDIFSDSVANTFTITSKDALTLEAWSHVGYSVDTLGKTIRVFVNGILSNVAELPLLLWCPEIVTETVTQTFETSHPYSDDMRQYWHVKIPNAFKYSITFDEKCATESGCDYLRFYKGTSRSNVVGVDKYTGRSLGQDMKSKSLEILDKEFDIYFYSDGSQTDWGFKLYVTATSKCAGSGGERLHEDVNNHPFFFGQAPGYATSERAATCAISQGFVVNQTLSEEQMRYIAFNTTHYSNLPAKLQYFDDLSRVWCPRERILPLNAYAHIPALKSIFTVVVKDLGPENNFDGFSIGLIQNSSILTKAKDDFILVGRDAVSYGVFFNGTEFDISYSRTPKRRRSSYSVVSAELPSTLNCPLSVGDKISLIIDLVNSTFEIVVSGPHLNISKKFGLPADVKEPSSYILSASLGVGHSIQLVDDAIVQSVNTDRVSLQGPIALGSRVRIKPVLVEAARVVMKKKHRGGWASGMEKCLGKFGNVTEKIRDNVWRVNMEDNSENFQWSEELLELVGPASSTMPETAVSSAPQGIVEVGSRVRIKSVTAEAAEAVMDDNVGWVSEMAACLGHFGVVKQKDSDGTLTVLIESLNLEYCWNPSLVELISEGNTSVPSPSTSISCRTGHHIILSGTCTICVRCGLCSGYGAGCVRCKGRDRSGDRGKPCGCGSGRDVCSGCHMCQTCCDSGASLTTSTTMASTTHPGCAALRPTQHGDNTCRTCGGRFKTCFGSYGHRSNNGTGTWQSGPCPADLSYSPESPNTSWCSEACERFVMSGGGVGTASGGSITEGSKVILASNYESITDASSGPLSPGDVGTVADVDRSDNTVRVEYNGRRWWYQQRALQLALSGSSETPSMIAGGGVAARVNGPITMGSQVVLTSAYASHSDASSGPLRPGDVGTVNDPDVSSRINVKFNSKSWWYDRAAVTLYIPSTNPAALATGAGNSTITSGLSVSSGFNIEDCSRKGFEFSDENKTIKSPSGPIVAFGNQRFCVSDPPGTSLEWVCDFSDTRNSAFGIGFVVESKMSDPNCIQKSNECGFLNSSTGGGSVKKLDLNGKVVTIRADSTSKNLTLLISDIVVETVPLPTEPGYFGFCGWNGSKMKLISGEYKTALSTPVKVQGTVQYFDIGFGTMDLPMTASNIGSLGAAESIGIIGAICRVSYMSLKSQSVSGIQRLLSHDILSPLIRLSLMADSISIRSVATKSLCSLLPYSLPPAALTALKTVIPEATSFVECLITLIGSKICDSAYNLGIAPLAFTEVYQYLDILTSLFISDSEWSTELENVLSRCIDTSLALCSNQIPGGEILIGLLTFCQNKQRLARVSPGNVIFVKESANSVLEKYIVLTHSKEGKFEEFFDVSPEHSLDQNFSLVRVHKSSIVDCLAHISFDENQSVSLNSSQTLSKTFLFCLQKMPEKILRLMMSIVSIPDDFDQKYDVLYSKSIAFGILSTFVSQYREGSYIDPSTHIDAAFYNICRCWPIFVHSIVENAISTRMPFNCRQPEKIETDSFLLLQMLMNGVKREETSIELGKSSSAVGALVTLLSEYLQAEHEYKDVKGMVFTMNSTIGVKKVHTIDSNKTVLSDINQCMNFALDGVSDSNLTFDGSTAKRVGSVSCYPAAFVALVSRQCMVTFELLEGQLGSNNMSFGLCRRSFPKTSSDGFGKQSDSWGVIDNRNTSATSEKAFVGYSGSRLSECRKFIQGDKISLSVDLDQSSFAFDLNDGEYVHKFNIPSENTDAYYFGATFANDHKIGIIESFTTAGHSESSAPVMHMLADPKERLKSLMKLFSSNGRVDILLPNDSSDPLATSMKLKVTGDKTKTKFKCRRGHHMLLYAGTKTAGVPDNAVICGLCKLSGIESDPEKFYFCKTCAVSFCVVCSFGLNGQVLCANFKSEPPVLRVPCHISVISGLKSTTATKTYSLLVEIIKSWPKLLPLFQAEDALVERAMNFGSLQLLLKLGGLDELRSTLDENSDFILKAIRESVISDDKELSPVAQTLVSACSWYFSKSFCSEEAAFVTVKANTDVNSLPVDMAPLQIEVSKVSSTNSTNSGSNMLTEDTSTFWQSSGSKPHWFELVVPDGIIWTDVMMFSHDYGSYSPICCNVKVGETVIKSDVSVGRTESWESLATYEDFVAAGSPLGNTIRIEITKNYDGGCDSKVAAVKVIGGLSRSIVTVDSSKLLIEEAAKDFVQTYGYGGSIEAIIAAARSGELPETILLHEPMARIAFNKLQALVNIESDSDLFSLVTTHATVSAVTALKLLDIIADIRGGQFLVTSDVGLYFLDCLNSIIYQIHTLPADMVSCIVDLVSKLLTIAQCHSKLISSDALARLKQCGQQMISTIKNVTVEVVKTPSSNLTQSDLYQSLLYTAVLSVNYLGLSLVDSQEQSTSKRNKTFIFAKAPGYTGVNIREGKTFDTPIVRVIDANSPPFEIDDECIITHNGRTIRRLHLADGSGWTSFNSNEDETVFFNEIFRDTYHPPIIIESPHPYKDDMDIYQTVEVSGASGYEIKFSSESRTEDGCDYVRFYKDDSHCPYFGESKYTGGQGGSSRNFPGVDDRAPLIINAPRFVFYFHSDGSRNDWGYKIEVKPRLGEEEVQHGMKRIGVLARLHRSLQDLTMLDQNTRAIDETLILYIETEKKGRISRMEDLSQMSWSALTDSDTSACITGYPSLLAAVSKAAEASHVDTTPTSTIEISNLPSEDQGPLTFLFESFPNKSQRTVVDIFISCDRNVDECSTILQDVEDADTASQDTFNAVPLATNWILSERYNFIKQFNEDFKECYDLINFGEADKFYSIANLLTKHRAYLLYIVKGDLFSTSLTKSAVAGDSSEEIVVHRGKALKFSSKGECDTKGLWSTFGQVFRALHGKPVARFRRSDQLFKVLFAGERGHDAGGLYRECWSTMAQDLMSGNLPLLRPCPNARSLFGQNRETWVLNPDSTSVEQIQMFEFLGKLMGIACRSSHYMDITISPMAWKLIVGEGVTLDDYVGVDATECKRLSKLREICSQEDYDKDAKFWELDFTCISLGGKEGVELHRHGRHDLVTFDNITQYCDELQTYRLNEMSIVAAAVRRGLLTQIPPLMVSLIKWKDLETMVCGNPNVDVDLLKSCTEYSGYSESDRNIEWFWEVMREFSQNDRKAYLRFTWGRNRLPLSKEGFKQKMKISRSGNTDALPMSHTCFFSLDLPNYSSKDIMKQRITYAIYNCIAIDGDETSTGMRAAAMGFLEE